MTQARQQTPPEPEATLSGVQETLLITLYGKYVDFYNPRPILADRWAVDVLDRLGGPAAVAARLAGQPANVSGVAVRARALDAWTAAFLARHERATVLHLACGLDTRALRLAAQCGPGVRWVDLDLPGVVAVRRAAVPEPDLPGGYRLVGASVAEEGWLLDVPADRPTLVVFEGLSMYLSREELRALVQRVAARFPEGEIIFDGMSPVCVYLLNSWLRYKGGWDVTFRWGTDYPRQLEEWHQGLKLRDFVLTCQAPGVERLPFGQRLRTYVMSWIPYLRSMFFLLKYEF